MIGLLIQAATAGPVSCPVGTRVGGSVDAAWWAPSPAAPFYGTGVEARASIGPLPCLRLGARQHVHRVTPWWDEGEGGSQWTFRTHALVGGELGLGERWGLGAHLSGGAKALRMRQTVDYPRRRVHATYADTAWYPSLYVRLDTRFRLTERLGLEVDFQVPMTYWDYYLYFEDDRMLGLGVSYELG